MWGLFNFIIIFVFIDLVEEIKVFDCDIGDFFYDSVIFLRVVGSV